jgi:hypothetical protein
VVWLRDWTYEGQGNKQHRRKLGNAPERLTISAYPKRKNYGLSGQFVAPIVEVVG